MKTFNDRIKKYLMGEWESYNGFFDLFTTLYERRFPMTKKKINKCIDKIESL